MDHNPTDLSIKESLMELPDKILFKLKYDQPQTFSLDKEVVNIINCNFYELIITFFRENKD